MISLKGKRIILRALEPEDLEPLMRWENDPENWHLGGTLSPYSRHILKNYLENAHQSIYHVGQLRLIIALQSGQPVGTIDLFDFDAYHQRAGLGILIGEKSYRGQGLASETLELIIPYALEHLDLQQLYANILAQNKISQKLFEKHGFVAQGRKRNWIKRNGSFEDELFYQLVKED